MFDLRQEMLKLFGLFSQRNTGFKVVLPDELISIIESAGIGSIFVLGGSVTGKTTLIESLVEILADRFSLGVVDCDS